MRYKLIPKKTALISSNSVLCVLTEVKAKMNIVIPETLHESLLSWAEECSILIDLHVGFSWYSIGAIPRE